MNSPLQLADCLWLQGELTCQPLFRPLLQAFTARNVTRRTLPDHKDAAGWKQLKADLWKTDQHIMLHGLQAKDLKPLYEVFKDRKNFSILLIDWWNSPFWFTQNAEYILFNLYGGIAARTQGAKFCNGWRPPLLSFPERMVPYEFASSALRPAALLAQPFLERHFARLRAQDRIRPERLIFLPIPIREEDLPFHEEKPAYDFCNTGASCGFWIIRDAYAEPRYNFVNLYADRKRLFDLIVEREGKPYQIFDRRRFRERLPWDKYCNSILGSRFAISTGGIHQAAVPKYVEYACFGTPMIGMTVPYEFPWLDECLYPIDGLTVTREQLTQKLQEAFELQPRLRQNCLNLRDKLLRLYHPVQVFDMAQAQINGKPIPPGYLR
jgi:hypothetical protein